MKKKLNNYSCHITEDKSQGASQAMLYGTGLTESDMSKAEVGIASMWYEGNTCNMHLMELEILSKVVFWGLSISSDFSSKRPVL